LRRRGGLVQGSPGSVSQVGRRRSPRVHRDVEVVGRAVSGPRRLCRRRAARQAKHGHRPPAVRRGKRLSRSAAYATRRLSSSARQALAIVGKAGSEPGQPSDAGHLHVPGKLPFLDRSLSMILNNLAMLYSGLGRKGQAEPLLRQAMEVDRACLGEEHADTLYNLAGVCAAAGREAEAMTLLERVAAYQDRLLPHVTALPAESARESFLQSYYRCYQARLTLLVKHFGESPQAVRAGCDLVLRRKARWLEVLAGKATGSTRPQREQGIDATNGT